MGTTPLPRKMGWQPGERSEGNEESSIGFWQFEVEVEKRVRILKQRIERKPVKPIVTVNKHLKQKHPVSLLGEYCSKKRLGAPIYELCFECGPDHKKVFLFKVTVNKVEYKPSVSSRNKRMAKALAAQTCLQALEILPKPDSKTVKKP